MQRDGFAVRTAGSARQALDALAEEPADLVLLDLTLPDLSGTELLDAVREAWTGPVIVVSASVDALPVYRGLGAADAIGKPFDPSELVQKVKALLSPD